jgi:hypothetical protein
VTGREPSGLNLARICAEYRDFIIFAATEGLPGWRARMIKAADVPGNGNGYVGAELAALTLDVLAARMDEMRAAVIRLDKPAIPPRGSQI